jgi:hypothetical protein
MKVSNLSNENVLMKVKTNQIFLFNCKNGKSAFEILKAGLNPIKNYFCNKAKFALSMHVLFKSYSNTVPAA